MSYYQDVCHDERARDADRVHHNGRGELEDTPQPSRRKTTETGKSKTTLQDIKMEEDVTSNKKLTKTKTDQMLFMQNRLSYKIFLN